MMEYKIRFLTMDHGEEAMDRELNNAIKGGWELKDLLPGRSGLFVMFLQRPELASPLEQKAMDEMDFLKKAVVAQSPDKSKAKGLSAEEFGPK